MPFKKGMKKIGGRVKGTPNKYNVDILEDLSKIRTEDNQPVCIIKMFFAALDTMPPYQQVDALLEFMKFVYPQKRQVEIAPSDDQLRVLLIERLKTTQSPGTGITTVREVSPALDEPKCGETVQN